MLIRHLQPTSSLLFSPRTARAASFSSPLSRRYAMHSTANHVQHPTDAPGSNAPQTGPSPPKPPIILLEDSHHAIRDHHISSQAWFVLSRLRAANHQVYLVGGTIRDILLRVTPKDYDILTSAEPQHVAALFPRAFVLGRNFPICHVHHDGSIIEVSSFSTNTDPSEIPVDVAGMLDRMTRSKSKASRERTTASSRLLTSRRIAGKGENSARHASRKPTPPGSTDRKQPGMATWATARRNNALRRDFSVNGLLYDPFSRILYDYVSGMADCNARTLRALGVDPIQSFIKDPARIFRGIRLAARTILTIESSTDHAMHAVSHLVAGLPQGRLQMELTSVMAYGASAPSVELLWRYRLLEMVLPHHAALFVKYQQPRVAIHGIHNTNLQGILLNRSNKGQKPKKKNEMSLITPATANSPFGDQYDASSNSDLTSHDQATQSRSDTAKLPVTPPDFLFHVLSILDSYGYSHKPVDTSVWIAVLAMPLIMEECKKERKKRKILSTATDAIDADKAQQPSSWSPSWLHNIMQKAQVPLPIQHSTNNDGCGDDGDDSGRERCKVEYSSDEYGVGVGDEIQPSREYLLAYSEIVDHVMLCMLSMPPGRVRRMLAHAAADAEAASMAYWNNDDGDNGNDDLSSSKESSVDYEGNALGVEEQRSLHNNDKDRKKYAGRAMSTADNVYETRYEKIFSSMSCILPRQSVELAGQLLKLEAELRGCQTNNNEDSSAPDEVGDDALSYGDAKRKNKRKRRKRGSQRVSANEQLIIEILRYPELNWNYHTRLVDVWQ